MREAAEISGKRYFGTDWLSSSLDDDQAEQHIFIRRFLFSAFQSRRVEAWLLEGNGHPHRLEEDLLHDPFLKLDVTNDAVHAPSFLERSCSAEISIADLDAYFLTLDKAARGKTQRTIQHGKILFNLKNYIQRSPHVLTKKELRDRLSIDGSNPSDGLFNKMRDQAIKELDRQDYRTAGRRKSVTIIESK